MTRMFLYGDLNEAVKNQRMSLYSIILVWVKTSPSCLVLVSVSSIKFSWLKGSHIDSSLFILSTKGTHDYKLVYIDDIILTGNNPMTIDHIIKSLSQKFVV